MVGGLQKGHFKTIYFSLLFSEVKKGTALAQPVVIFVPTCHGKKVKTSV
jgi:hypothetical protein